MTNLSDAQRILLAAAAQRDGGSLLPRPASLKPGAGTNKAVAGLLKLGFAEESETHDASVVHRRDGDIDFGVFITATGAAAIGIQPFGDDSGSAITKQPTAAGTAEKGPRASSKAAKVITLMSQLEGATLPELIEATGWLPHTTRAALTGLRKRGYNIVRSKRDGVTCYRITAVA